MTGANRSFNSVSGDDSSTTGSSVQADMVHSEVSGKRAASATTIGTRSGAQNATTASRRSGVAGHSMS